jgi:hypothetical protein
MNSAEIMADLSSHTPMMQKYLSLIYKIFFNKILKPTQQPTLFQNH